MLNKGKRNSIIAATSVVAISSISIAVAVIWTWSNTKKDYNVRYNQVKNILDKLNTPKEDIIKKFKLINPDYINTKQFHQLDKVVDLILKTLKKSINSKENNLKTVKVNRLDFKDEFDMIDYNESLNYINGFDNIINQIQNPDIKKDLIDNLVSDTSSKNSKLQLDNLKKTIEDQETEIRNLKVEISKNISSLPEVLREKFNEKLNNSGDDIVLLKGLKDELDKYIPIVEKAQKIKNLFKKSEIYVDINNSNLDDLPWIEAKIEEILRSENLSEYDRNKERVENLINVIEDEDVKNNFLEKLADIDKTKSMQNLLELEKEVEKYLKDNSGIDGLIKYKKKELLDRVNNSDLDDQVKQNYLDDIKVSNNLDELLIIEDELDKLISNNNRKKEVIEIVKLLNNPKKQELLNELSTTKDPKVVERVYNDATKILSDETEKTKKAIERLRGLPRLKNDFELMLSESKTQREIQEVATSVNDYINDLIKRTNETVNSLDSTVSVKIDEEIVTKATLQKELSNLNENAIASQYANILEKANTLKNYHQAKESGKNTADLIDNQEKANELKEKLENSKTLDDALRAKAEIDRLYQFQLDKELAKEAIKKVLHEVKREDFNKRLNDATSSDELVILTSDAIKYHDAENSNKLSHDELTYFVDKNIGNDEKKTGFKKELDDAMLDSNSKNNIDQDEIYTKLAKIRGEINEFIKQEKDAAETLRLKKEQIKADIQKISDQDKKNQFNDELIDVLNIEQAEKLEEKVLQQLEFEKTKSVIEGKVSNLEDKKDYFNDTNGATSLEKLKEIEARVDQDLKREADELKNVKDSALEKIVDISDSNPLKGELFDEVEKAKTKEEVNKIIEIVDKFLSDLREKAIISIATTVGDDEVHSELNADLGGAKNEVLLNDIIKKASETFGDKKTTVIEEFGKLSDSNPSKEEIKQRLNDATNINELNGLLEEIKSINNIENFKNDLRNKLEQVQETSKKQELINKIDGTDNLEELQKVNEEIDAQIQKEKDEIQANKDIVREKIKQLYKDENIELFNNQILKNNLSLDESRQLVKNIDTTISLEQNELSKKIDEAIEKINNTLTDSEERNEILLEAESSKNLKSVDNALNNLDKRIKLLKEEARNEAKKLILNSELLGRINQATTQSTIDQVKAEAVELFNSKKQKVLEKLNAIITVSTNVNIEIKNSINQAQNESILNQLSSLVDSKLDEFNQETENQVNRLFDKSNILSSENWTNETISQNQRNTVQNIIDGKWTNYQEALNKLIGDQENHKKYSDILDSLDQNIVNESTLNQYISEMNNIFDSKKSLVSSNIEAITNEVSRNSLNDKLTKVKNIEDLNNLQKQVNLQRKKEELIQSLNTKIVFEDQKDDFTTRINDATELDQLINSENGLEKEINDKQIYNNELIKEVDAVNALNEKINVTNSKHNEFKNQIDSARTKEKISAIKEQINNYINSEKDKVKPFIEKLVGSNEKEIKTNELSISTSESEIQNILEATKKIFSDKQENIKEILNEVSDEIVKNNFNTSIDNASNLKELDDIKEEINNQKIREKIQSGIDKLTDSNEKDSLQEELNNLTNDKINKTKLNQLKEKVDTARSKQEGEFAIQKEQALNELAKLLPENSERIRLETLLNTYTNDQTDLENVKKVKEDAIAEFNKIKNKIKNDSKENIQPRNRDKESPTHTEKYNDFNRQLDSATTEKELRNISDQMTKYVEDVKDLYTKYVDSNLPIESIRNEIKESLSTKTKINDLDSTLKEANKKTKDVIQELINEIEDNGKKEELNQKLIDATANDIVEPNQTKWRNELTNLKAIYDEVQSFRNNEKRELESLKTEIKNKIQNSLNDRTDDVSENSKAKLLQLIDEAKTKVNANAVLEKLEEKINTIKNIAKEIVEKTKGSNLYDNLKEDISFSDVDTEQEILLIQQKATEEFEKNKKSTEDAIKLVNNQDKKTGLETEKTNSQNIEQLNIVKNKALLEAKKEQLKELVKPLWDKKQYNDDIDQATTLDKLDEIEKLISNDKREQDRQLRAAKDEARLIVDKLEDKTSKLSQIEGATTLDVISKIKNDAIEVINNLKNEIKPLLDKIEGSDRYNEFAIRNSDDANELTLKQLKNELISEFTKLKENAKNKISEPASLNDNTVTVDEYDKKQQLLNEAESASNYRDLHNLENTSEVEKYAKYVKDEISKVINKENMLNEVEEILKNRPSTDEDKNQKINALEEIAIRARSKERQETTELESSRENAINETKEKINLNGDKQTEFIDLINKAKTKEDVQEVISNVQKYIQDERGKVLTELTTKLIENQNPRNTLTEQLNNANDEVAINSVKEVITRHLNNLKENAKQAVNNLSEDIEKHNVHSDYLKKLEDATALDTEKAYNDVIGEVNKQLNTLKEWAKTKLNNIKNQSDRDQIRDLIAAAGTSAEIKDLENRVNLTIAKEAAIESINKLSNTNNQKNQLLDFVNSSTNITEINNKKVEAEKIINDKKENAKLAVEKINGNVAYVKAKEDLKNADNEDELDRLIKLGNDLFTDKQNEVRSEIDKLVSNKDGLSIDNLDNIQKLKDYVKNTIVPKAKEYTNDVINRITNEARKQELQDMLTNKSDVVSVNEIYELASNEISKEDALERAKTSATEFVESKLSGQELDLFKNRIKNADNLEQIKSIRQEIQSKVDEKIRELTKLKNNFLDSNEVKRTVDNSKNNSIPEIEKSIQDLKNEKNNITSKTAADLEKIHIIEIGLLSPEKTTEENREYDILKSEFDNINDSNWTEAKNKEISSRVEQALLSRKNKAREYINRLGLDSTKNNELITKLNSNETDTLTKIIKLEQKADRELKIKLIKEKISRLSDEELKRTLNAKANNENEDLNALEVEVDNKLAEQENAINLSKEDVRREVNKLPSNEKIEENRKVDEAKDLTTLDNIKQKAIERMETLRNEVQQEIDKMPLNARNSLNNNKQNALNNGDELLSLKQLAIETVNEYNLLNTKNNTQFSNEQKAKEFFSAKLNSSSADTKEEIKSLSNSFDLIKNKLNTLRTKQNELGQDYKNEFDSMVNNVFNNNNKEIIGNNSINSELDSIIEKINFRKKQNDAIKQIKAKFENINQTTSIVNEINNLTSKDEQGLNQLISKSNTLFNNLENLKNQINSIGVESNRTVLLNEWNNTDTISKKEVLDSKTNSFKNILNSTKQELENLSGLSQNKESLRNELNNATTNQKVEEVRNKIRKEKSALDWNQIKTRLKNSDKKTQWDQRVNSSNSSDQIKQVITEATNYLEEKRRNAINVLNRLNSENSIRSNSASKTTAYSSEADYEQVLNNSLKFLSDEAKKANIEFNKLTNETKTRHGLRYQYNLDSNGNVENNITERMIKGDIKQVGDILRNIYNSTKEKLNLLNGDSIELSKYNTKIGNEVDAPKKTESQYNDIKKEIEGLYNSKRNEAQKLLSGEMKNQDKKREFESEFAAANNLGKLKTLIDKLINYYEVLTFNTKKPGETTTKTLWKNEDVVGEITLNKFEGKYKNKYVYLVAKSKDSDNYVTSEPMQLNNSKLGFRFSINKFIRNGNYDLNRVVVLDTNNNDRNTILNSRNTIDITYASLSSFSVEIENFKANNVIMTWTNLDPIWYENSHPQGEQIIEKATQANVNITGFTSNSTDNIQVSDIKLYLKGEAKINNLQFSNDSFNNLTLIHNLILDNANSNLIFTRENNSNNWSFSLKPEGMKAGYIYNVDKIEFNIVQGSEKTKYVYKKDKDNTTQNLIKYSDNYSYTKNNVFADSWLFKLPKDKRDKMLLIDDSKSIYPEYIKYRRNGERLETRLAFKDGWDINVFAGLFRYLNSFAPETHSIYEKELKDNENTKLALRDKWIDFFVDRISNKFKERYNQNDRNTIPTNRWYGDNNSVSLIQLGISSDKTQYNGLVIRGKNQFAPVLGGKNMYFDFKTSQIHLEKMKKFMKTLNQDTYKNNDSDENHMSEWVMWLEGMRTKGILPRYAKFDSVDEKALRDTISAAFEFILAHGATNFIGDKMEYPKEYVKNK
ncbi:hypothetical protein [Mycoplasma sp. OR1901]|uniref:hypothetical protein n=1 Tax=Mycoplasma sp. OR1901 TaxID=2742195 RepID=UPI001581AD58|nr:hypothetical protein [Mycoplasma sp. OR1901]QKT05314.1 hypothetical protein HTZ87_01185 [Mycoplasma sp. OR1901]